MKGIREVDASFGHKIEWVVTWVVVHVSLWNSEWCGVGGLDGLRRVSWTAPCGWYIGLGLGLERASWRRGWGVRPHPRWRRGWCVCRRDAAPSIGWWSEWKSRRQRCVLGYMRSHDVFLPGWSFVAVKSVKVELVSRLLAWGRP